MAGNEEFLEDVPHVILEDMAFVVRINFDPYSTVVTNQLLKGYGITEEQLFQDAKEMARFSRRMKIQPIADCLSTQLGDMAPEGLEEILNPIPLYVCMAGTIKDQYGAGVMIYPEFARRAFKELGGAFYILPSSQHEVLLCKDMDYMDAETMAEMVREINATQVAEEDRLTDSVYYCDGVTIRKVA